MNNFTWHCLSKQYRVRMVYIMIEEYRSLSSFLLEYYRVYYTNSIKTNVTPKTFAVTN